MFGWLLRLTLVHQFIILLSSLRKNLNLRIHLLKLAHKAKG